MILTLPNLMGWKDKSSSGVHWPGVEPGPQSRALVISLILNTNSQFEDIKGCRWNISISSTNLYIMIVGATMQFIGHNLGFYTSHIEYNEAQLYVVLMIDLLCDFWTLSDRSLSSFITMFPLNTLVSAPTPLHKYSITRFSTVTSPVSTSTGVSEGLEGTGLTCGSTTAAAMCWYFSSISWNNQS